MEGSATRGFDIVNVDVDAVDESYLASICKWSLYDNTAYLVEGKSWVTTTRKSTMTVMTCIYNASNEHEWWGLRKSSTSKTSTIARLEDEINLTAASLT